MRLSTYLAAAAALVAFGFLGFRILDLEQRVALLSEQVGAPVSAGTDGGTPTSQPAAGSQRGYEQRIAALEKRLQALSSHSSSRSDSAPEAAPSSLSRDQAILSVVERENTRIREVQLEWHRSRWLETREKQLETFATQLQLSPGQTSELRGAVQSEIDRMVEIMKRPSFAEEPDQVANDWQAILSETDKRAASVLTPEQQQLWLQGRLFERRTLWPWLPEQATAQR